MVGYSVEGLSYQFLYPWTDSSQDLSEPEEPLEIVAADHNDGCKGGLNTTEPTVAAILDCPAVTPGADKREGPGAVEVV